VKRTLLLLAVLLPVLSAVLAQEGPRDEAHFRREIARDPAQAVDELNTCVHEAKEGERPLLLLLRAVALARLGEKRDALVDARAVLAEPREERLEVEAAALVRELRGIAVEIVPPSSPRVGEKTTVALVGSARGALACEWTVYRMDERRLRESLAARPDLDELLRRPPARVLARVDSGRETIDAAGAFERTIPVEAAREPGIYHVAATVADVPLRTTIRVARHGVALRVTAEGALAFVFDLETGEPREGALVDVLGARFDPVGATDASGVRDLGPGKGRVLAWADGAFVPLPLDGIAPPTSAAPPVDFVLARPLVHPGESVHAVALARPGTWHRVTLRDARGLALGTRDVTVGEEGAAALDFAIPRVARCGDWWLDAPGGRARFRVEAVPVEPPFSVEVFDVPPEVVSGETFVVHVRATTAGTASWVVRPRGRAEVLLSGSGALDEDGELKIAALSLPPGELVLEATVRDAAGRAVSRASPVHVAASRLVAVVEREPPALAREGEGLDLRIVFLDRKGERARDVSLVASATLDGAPFLEERRALESNVASLHVPLARAGVVRVSVVATSPLGEARLSRELLVAGDGLGRPAALRLDTDAPAHRPGETLRVLARFPFESGSALVTLERGAILSRRSERIVKGQVFLELPLEAKDAPGLEVVFASVREGVLHSAGVHVAVDQAPLPFGLEVASTDPLSVALTSPEACLVHVLASDARPAELLPETVLAHGPRSPESGRFVSRSVRVVEAHPGVPPAPPDDEALVARARSLVLAPELAVVASTGATVELPIGGSLRLTGVAAHAGRFALAGKNVEVAPPLSVAVDLPARLVEGDEGELRASVANDQDAPQEVKLSWTVHGLVLRGPPRLKDAKVQAGHEPEADALWVLIPARGRASLAFVAKAPVAGVARLELVAQGEKLRAQGSADAPVLGRSVPRQHTESGLLGGAPLLLSPGTTDAARPGDVAVDLVIAPSLAACARDALASLAASEERDAPTLAALLAPDAAPLFSACGIAREPDLDALLSLVELQEPDGSWPSSATACALEAIAACRSEGAFLEAPLTVGIAAARRELAGAGLREAPMLVVALARAGAATKDEVDRVYERRGELDAAGRGALARVVDGDRARELLAVARGTVPTEALASELLALGRLGEEPERRARLVTELLARREGVVWSTPRETGLAVRALLEHAARTPARLPGRLELRVLDGEKRGELLAKGVDVRSGATPSLAVRIPTRLLASNPAIEVRQRGGDLVPYSMQVRWTKLTQGLKSLDAGVALKRSCARLATGEDGTASLEPVETKGVPHGSEVRITLSVDSHALEPIVVEEPLPAGARFLGEVGASGARIERRPGRLLVRFSPEGKITRAFTYALRAERPGDWRALPARAWIESRGEAAGESDELFLRIKD
jgi:hypothetical protein